MEWYICLFSCMNALRIYSKRTHSNLYRYKDCNILWTRVIQNDMKCQIEPKMNLFSESHMREGNINYIWCRRFTYVIRVFLKGITNRNEDSRALRLSKRNHVHNVYNKVNLKRQYCLCALYQRYKYWYKLFSSVLIISKVYAMLYKVTVRGYSVLHTVLYWSTSTIRDSNFICNLA